MNQPLIEIISLFLCDEPCLNFFFPHILTPIQASSINYSNISHFICPKLLKLPYTFRFVEAFLMSGFWMNPFLLAKALHSTL